MAEQQGGGQRGPQPTDPNTIMGEAPGIPPGGNPGDVASAEMRQGTNMNPGDELPAGYPGAGENVCPDCNGSGKQGAQPCQTCGGTGKEIESVAGGP